MKKFNNMTERSFYDFLMSEQKYKESTVLHYIQRLRLIEAINELINKNIDAYIKAYETGRHMDLDIRSHRAYSNALKHFKEYMIYKGLLAYE